MCLTPDPPLWFRGDRPDSPSSNNFETSGSFCSPDSPLDLHTEVNENAEDLCGLRTTKGSSPRNFSRDVEIPGPDTPVRG